MNDFTKRLNQDHVTPTSPFFSPKAPEGKEANWIQTVKGKGWFCLLRLYSPTEAW